MERCRFYSVYFVFSSRFTQRTSAAIRDITWQVDQARRMPRLALGTHGDVLEVETQQPTNVHPHRGASGAPRGPRVQTGLLLPQQE